MDGDLTLIVAGGAFAAVVGSLVMNLFKRPEEELDEPDINLLKKKKKEPKEPKKAKATKKKAKAKAKAAESEEDEEDIVIVPTPPPAEKKKKKKKKAAAEAAPVETAKQKKKREKKERAAAEAAAAEAAAAASAAPSKKKKAKAKTATEDDGWEIVPQSYRAQPAKAVVPQAADKKPQLVLDLGEAKMAVIGRGGSVIQGIQSDTGAKLDIQKGSSVCTITGSEEAVAAAAAQVRQIMVRVDSIISEVVNVKQDRIPAIIGKGGTKIKELEAESGATIKVEKESNVVRVKGDAAQVMKAKALIELVVNPPEPVYETTTTMDLSLLPMGKNSVYVIKGKGGVTIRAIEQETGAKLDIERGSSILKIQGAQMAVVNALNLVSKVLAENGNTISVPLTDKKQIGAVLGKGGINIRNVEDKSGARVNIQESEDGAQSSVQISGTQEACAKAAELVKTLLEGGPIKPIAGPGQKLVEVTVPDSAKGSIIGRGGETIKKIQESSGANVDIPKGLGVAWVLGSPKAVDSAVSMINKKIAEAAQQDADREKREEAARVSAAETTALFAAANAEDASWNDVPTDEQWGGSSGADGW